jgi:hypothetical protein
MTYSQLDGRLKRNRRAIQSVQYQVQVVVNNNEQPLERPRQFGGTVADINTAHIVPIDPNPQNAQLFYYCKLPHANRYEYSTKKNRKRCPTVDPINRITRYSFPHIGLLLFESSEPGFLAPQLLNPLLNFQETSY